MSGLTGIQDERDLHLKLFLAVVIYVSPFLLLFHVGDLDGLIRMLAAVIRRVYVLGMVVTLKRQNEEVDRWQRWTIDYPCHGEGCTAHGFATRRLGCDPTKQASREVSNHPE